jgi:hypothetical protein
LRVAAVSANLLHGYERFILQNQDEAARHATALKRATQRAKSCRAMYSASSFRDSMHL